MKNLFNIEGKTIVVTGANRGNGLAIAKGLVDAGASVIRVDQVFNAEIGAADIVCDLSSRQELRVLISTIKAKYSYIDGLVNNAGVSFGSKNPYDDIDLYEKTIAVNLSAPFVLTSALIPLMSTSGGSIVNITSLGSLLGFPDNPAYQISKAGLAQFTRAIARDWAKNNIRANNICPGYIITDMTKKSFDDPILNKERVSRMMFDHWGESRDLVGAVVFLLSNASSYVTGIDIPVDGGWLANGL